MDKLEKRTLDVSRGLTYTYYTSDAKDNLQTLLLVHGFPSSTRDWNDVVRDYLLPNGYGVVVVDSLGYSGTSKPLESEAYSTQLIAQDLTEILDQESLDKVISLGHDWVSPHESLSS